MTRAVPPVAASGDVADHPVVGIAEFAASWGLALHLLRSSGMEFLKEGAGLVACITVVPLETDNSRPVTVPTCVPAVSSRQVAWLHDCPLAVTDRTDKFLQHLDTPLSGVEKGLNVLDLSGS